MNITHQLIHPAWLLRLLLHRPASPTVIPSAPMHHLPFLELLSITYVSTLLRTFPYFHPQNILSRAWSSIAKTPAEVIFQPPPPPPSPPPTPSDEIPKAQLLSSPISVYGLRPLINCTKCGRRTFHIQGLRTTEYFATAWIHTAILGVLISAEFLSGNNKVRGVWLTHATCASQ